MLYLLRQLIFCALLILVLLIEGMSLAEPTGKEKNAMPDPDDVSAIMKKAKEDAKNMTIPANRFAKEGMQAARQTESTFLAPEFQERIQCEQERLEKEVFGQYIAPWKKKRQKVMAEQTVQSGSLSATEKVFLFISSSMPDDTVHAYISVISRIPEPNIVLVMQQFPDRA